MASTTTTNKVQYDGVVNATVKYNNSNDPARTYDISAEFQVSGDSVTAVNSGTATRKSDSIGNASFSAWGGDGVNVTISSVSDKAEQVSLFSSIVDFISEVKEQVSNSSLNA